MVRRFISSDEKNTLLALLTKAHGQQLVTNDIRTLMRKASDICALGAIRYLIPLVFHKNPTIATASAQQISGIYHTAESHQLIWLDESLRRYYPYSDSPQLFNAWTDLTILQVHQFSFPDDFSLVTLSLLCAHPNGYIRQEALKSIAKIDTTMALQPLFIRCNDWVTPVRAYAEKALSKILKPLPASRLVEHLVFIDHLRQRKRFSDSRVNQLIESRLVKVDMKEALVNVIRCGDFRNSRIAFNMACEFNYPIDKIIQAGSGSTDRLVRLWALKLARARLTGEKLSTYLDNAARDPSEDVKREAIYIQLEMDYALARPHLVSCLDSNRRSIREMTRFYLAKNETFDFAEHYRNAIKSHQHNITTGLLLGLAETGTISDCDLALRFESHPKPSVRACVIVAVHQLDPDTASTDWLLSKMLKGGITEIRNAKALLLQDNKFTLDDVTKCYNELCSETVKLHLLQLAGRREAWSIPSLLLNDLLRNNIKLTTTISNTLTHWISENIDYLWFKKPNWFTPPPMKWVKSIHQQSRLLINQQSRLLINQNDNADVIKELFDISEKLIQQWGE